MLARAHLGHQGIARTKTLVREHYWWPAMDKEIVQAINDCVECQNSPKTRVYSKPKVVPVALPEGPWERVAIDLIGPFSRRIGGFEYAVTLVDSYSRWPEIGFVHAVTSSSVMQVLDEIFAREGLPKVLLSDNGPQFISREFESFLRERGIRHETTALYMPAANGLVERWNGTVKAQLEIAMGKGEAWREYINLFLLQYRVTAHPVTGEAPSMLLHGRVTRAWANQGSGGETLVSKPVAKDATKWREEVAMKQKSGVARANVTRVRKPRFFSPGDMVWVRRPFGRGTHEGVIQERLSAFRYRLMDGEVWHVQRLAIRRKGKVRPSYDQVPEVAENAPEERYPRRTRVPPNRWL